MTFGVRRPDAALLVLFLVASFRKGKLTKRRRTGKLTPYKEVRLMEVLITRLALCEPPK